MKREEDSEEGGEERRNHGWWAYFHENVGFSGFIHPMLKLLRSTFQKPN